MAINHRKDRAADELIGVCRGIIADGSLVAPEVVFLRDWLVGNIEFIREYPFSVIAERVCDAIEDDVIDADEERDLIELCQLITGNQHVSHPVAAASKASGGLALTQPQPEVEFEGCVFVVTGIFDYGSRKTVVRAIGERGGIVRDVVTYDTTFLVIGNIRSDAWVHSTHGRKVEEAARRNVPIICETHWSSHL